MDEHIMNISQPSTPTISKFDVARSFFFSRKGAYGLGITVLVIFGLIFLLREKPVATTAGFLNRTFLDLRGLDRDVKVGGACLSSYIVYGSGIDDVGQHYAVTFFLNENPKDGVELVRLLDSSSCKKEQNEAEDTLIKRLSLEGRHDILVSISYKNKNGRRLVLPI
ncbi:MAG: hypothetical protein HZA36_02220 [Parcubacteria group bacterium]|nr:hypothetical protein [Parcubacteria group bacterium]